MTTTNQYNPDNIFNKIITKRIKSNILFENDFAIFIKDINPEAPVHVLAIPKNQYTDFHDFINKAEPQYISGYFDSIKKFIDTINLKNESYRLITNKGEYAGQTVMHFHTHIIGGTKLTKLL